MNSVDAPSVTLPLLQTLRRYRGLVLATTFVGLAAALGLAFATKPVYRAESLIAFNSDQSSGMGLAALIPQLGSIASMTGLNVGKDQNQKDIALSLITSRRFLADFIADEKLLPVLFASRWDAQQKRWQTSWWRDPPTVAEGVELLQERYVTVTEDRRTGLVKVAIESTDPRIAAAWSNKLVQRVNALTRRIAIAESRTSQTYLQRELRRTDVIELRQAIYRLLEAELKKEMVASVRVQYSFRVVDPAVTPEANQFVRPKRALIIIFGVIAGFMSGVLLALAHNAYIVALRNPSAMA